MDIWTAEHSVCTLFKISQAIITIRGSSLHCPLAKPHHVATVAPLSLFSSPHLSLFLSWNVGPGAEKLFVTKLSAAVPSCSHHHQPAPCRARPGERWGLATDTAQVVTKLAEVTQHREHDIRKSGDCGCILLNNQLSCKIVTVTMTLRVCMKCKLVDTPQFI